MTTRGRANTHGSSKATNQRKAEQSSRQSYLPSLKLYFSLKYYFVWLNRLVSVYVCVWAHIHFLSDSAQISFRYLNHLCLSSHKWDIGKQYKPRSDAAERGVWSGSTLFAFTTGISIKHGNNQNWPDPSNWKWTGAKSLGRIIPSA